MEEKRDIDLEVPQGLGDGAARRRDRYQADRFGLPHFDPEQFENLEDGLRMINNSVYVTQLRRTKQYGELQPDVWASIQGPYVKQGEITKEIDPSTFLDVSFIAAANDWTTDDVKEGDEQVERSQRWTS